MCVRRYECTDALKCVTNTHSRTLPTRQKNQNVVKAFDQACRLKMMILYFTSWFWVAICNPLCLLSRVANCPILLWLAPSAEHH